MQRRQQENTMMRYRTPLLAHPCSNICPRIATSTRGESERPPGLAAHTGPRVGAPHTGPVGGGQCMLLPQAEKG